MTDALFVPEDGRFVPTRRAGSPWGDTLVHGGPPAGLLARAIERTITDPELFVTRLTVDLFRPVPSAPLDAVARTVRSGRRLQVLEASLLHDGVEVCRASALALRRSETPARHTPDVGAPPGPDGIATTSLGGGHMGERAGPIRDGFHTAIEARWVSRPGPGTPGTVWLRMPMPLVADEETTPLQRLAATCDFLNPVSGSGRGWTDGIGFINADCTIYVHRLPAGEWICLEVERSVEPYGLAVARAALRDTKGPIGRAMQALLANTLR